MLETEQADRMQWTSRASGKGMLTPFLPLLQTPPFPAGAQSRTGLVSEVQPQAKTPGRATAGCWGPRKLQANQEKSYPGVLLSWCQKQLYLVMKISRKPQK